MHGAWCRFAHSDPRVAAHGHDCQYSCGASQRGEVFGVSEKARARCAQVTGGACRCVSEKIIGLKDLNYDSATEVTDVLQQGSWNDSERTILSAAVRDRLEKAAGVGDLRNAQSCPTFELYLTQPEWAQITDASCPQTNALVVLRAACARIGLLNPDEPTTGRIAEIVKYCNMVDAGANMSSEEWYNFLQRTKQVLRKNKKVQWDQAWITESPSDPHLLPAEIFAAAFPDATGPPALREVPQLGALPPILRRSHASLRTGSMTVNPAQPSGLADVLNQLFGPAMAQLLRQASETPPAASLPIERPSPVSAPHLRGLQIFTPPKRAAIATSEPQAGPGATEGKVIAVHVPQPHVPQPDGVRAQGANEGDPEIGEVRKQTGNHPFIKPFLVQTAHHKMHHYGVGLLAVHVCTTTSQRPFPPRI